MATAVSPVLAFVADLATGVTGTGRVVPASTFQADRYAATPGDPAYPEVNVERTLALVYTGAKPTTDPVGSPYQGCDFEWVYCDLAIAYRYDVEPAAVGTDPGEDRTSRARLRAADDRRVILRALTWPPNYGAASNGSTIVSIEPSGPHRIEDLGDGVLRAVQPLAVLVQFDPATAHDLGASIETMQP